MEKEMETMTKNKLHDVEEKTKKSEDERIQKLLEKIRSARKELKEYLEQNSLKAADEMIGGQEGRAIKYSIAALDSDGDGDLSAEELEKLDEQIEGNIEKTLNLLLNAGVVSALILSMVFGWTFSPLSFTQDSLDFFGQSVCDWFNYMFILCINTAVFGSFGLIFTTVRMYTHLAFWLTTNESKTKYLSEVSMNIVAAMTLVVINSAVFAIPFGALVAVSPGAGLISTIFAVASFLWLFLYFVEYRIGLLVAMRIAVEETEQLLGMKRHFAIKLF